MVSWVTGRPPMVAQATALTANGSDGEEPEDYFSKTMELYEINNYTTVSQYLYTQRAVSDKLGMPPLQESRDILTVVSQLDDCLERWERRLPPALRYEGFAGDVNNCSYGQALCLRLR